MSNSLINSAACKEFALRWAQENRKGWNPQRVSRQFLDDLNAKMRMTIQGAIAHHPSNGKTIKYLF